MIDHFSQVLKPILTF